MISIVKSLSLPRRIHASPCSYRSLSLYSHVNEPLSEQACVLKFACKKQAQDRISRSIRIKFKAYIQSIGACCYVSHRLTQFPWRQGQMTFTVYQHISCTQELWVIVPQIHESLSHCRSHRVSYSTHSWAAFTSNNNLFSTDSVSNVWIYIVIDMQNMIALNQLVFTWNKHEHIYQDLFTIIN